VFGLDINTSRLISHRIKRLSDFGLSVFRRGGFTVIKVTNKPIESVANEIIEHS
jgi:regulator of PEP synthase PpsR (kinase-PPPase family)